MSFVHKGHAGSMTIPRFTRTPRNGSALWSICHKKNLYLWYRIKLPNPFEWLSRMILAKTLMGSPCCRTCAKCSSSGKAPAIGVFMCKDRYWNSQNLWKIGSLFKTIRSLLISHILSWVINALTVQSGLDNMEQSLSRISTKLVLSNQLSHQKLICSPVPTIHLNPFLSSERHLNMLFHAGESPTFWTASKQLDRFKYLAVIISTQRFSFSCSTSQANLHWKARLTASVFLSPSPLSFLGW